VSVRLRRAISVKTVFQFTTALFLLSFISASSCHAQSRDVLCRDGVGVFETEFHHTGVTVHVGAGRNQELAARVCEASLI